MCGQAGGRCAIEWMVRAASPQPVTDGVRIERAVTILSQLALACEFMASHLSIWCEKTATSKVCLSFINLGSLVKGRYTSTYTKSQSSGGNWQNNKSMIMNSLVKSISMSIIIKSRTAFKDAKDFKFWNRVLYTRHVWWWFVMKGPFRKASCRGGQEGRSRNNIESVILNHSLRLGGQCIVLAIHGAVVGVNALTTGPGTTWQMWNEKCGCRHKAVFINNADTSSLRSFIDSLIWVTDILVFNFPKTYKSRWYRDFTHNHASAYDKNKMSTIF